MSDIKYRQYYPAKDINGTTTGDRFHYWGYVYPQYPDAFVSPLSGDGIKPSQRSTGFKDESGTELFEGDVVEWGINRLFKVVWNTKTPSFTLRNISRGLDIEDVILQKSYCSGMKIVGNIYQNPELLKAGTL